MKRVLVTGASGFVGRRLCIHLAHSGWLVRAASRAVPDAGLPGAVETCLIPDIGPDTDWSKALAGVDAVVHLAARVHVMHETAREGLQLHRHVNTAGTATLARAAARASAGRFVYLSTIKVNGERTTAAPFTETDIPDPVDAYAISKLEAEQQLAAIARDTGLQTTIFRPPLIYGPGVKGNFPRLVNLVRSGIPLPLASIKNSRSLLGIDNLISAIDTALGRPQPVNGTYLISDTHDLSTPELVRRIGIALNMPARLFHCPPALLLAAAGMAGRREEAWRMIESLRIDCARLRQELHWNPPVTVDAGLLAAVQSHQR